MEYKSKGLSLEVARGDLLDLWRCIVRIDETLMKKHKIDVHSFVEIKGKEDTHTGAIAIRARGVDRNKLIARMDSQIRQNIQVDLGDQVRIRPIKTIFASKIVIAPENEYDRVTKLSQRDLEFYPLCQGDRFFIKTSEKILYNRGLPFIHSQEEDLIRMRVISTEPRGIVTVDEKTGIFFLPFPHVGFLAERIFPVLNWKKLPVSLKRIFR